MHSASPAPYRAFRRLTIATLAAAFLLVLVGGVVRVSGSGLGCGPAGSGINGWPFCNGDLVPGVDLNAIIEYSHRALASIVGVLLIAMAAMAWRRFRSNTVLLAATAGAVGLVIAQGLLGALTVERDLEESLVAAHLGLAMALLALLLFILHRTRPTERPAGAGLRPLAVVASALVLCTIIAGGYMAGTQNYGRASYQLGDGAHYACGQEFPTCNGGFMPFGQSRLVNIHLTHRAFMYAAVALVAALAIVALRRGVAERYAKLALGVLAAQVLVGALNVWLDEYEALIVLHLGLGTLLWMTVVGLTLQLYPVRSISGSHAGRAEAVAA